MLLFTFEKHKEHNVCNTVQYATSACVHALGASLSPSKLILPGSRFAVRSRCMVANQIQIVKKLPVFLSTQRSRGTTRCIAARNAGGVDDVAIPVYDFTKTRCHISK